ncbi:MAG TPA: hypothetical protein VFY49_18620 [Myxococcota bacterium]|nr:hypothetical protein [Myxococcota bacterium]
MNGSSPRRRRVASCAAALAVALLAPPAPAEEEKELPSWIPSVGLGVGIQSRDIDGSIDAILATDAVSSSVLPCQGQPPTNPFLPPFTGRCDVSASDSRASDGAAFDISGQLLGPALSSVPLKPRPFVHGGFAFEYDSRTIVEQGFNPGNFDKLFGEPRIHTRLRANPDSLWYAGGGVALQMPIDFTPVFVKFGAHYMEERMDAIATIDRGIGSADEFISAESTESLKIGGAGPSFGVEAEVWRFGPVGVQFVADVLMTFPLTGSDARFQLQEPGAEPPACTPSDDPNVVNCVEPSNFDFDADNIHYLGVATFRFAWLGY